MERLWMEYQSMTHFDWELSEQQYDRDFILGLDLLKRIDLEQFVTDLYVNDKKTFERLRSTINRQTNENKYR
jgi:hypothetical protein